MSRENEKQGHSPEPWRIGQNAQWDIFDSSDGIVVCGLEDDSQQLGSAIANAAHIVACVNFCAGVDLSMLPSGNLKDLLAAAEALGGDAAEL